MNIIEKSVPREELLAGLAEECAELSRAALKLRRALTGTNPTPVTVKEAEAALREEVADVALMLVYTVPEIDSVRCARGSEIPAICADKEARWMQRLLDISERKGGGNRGKKRR